MHESERLLAYRNGPPLAALVRSFLHHFPELDALDFELDLLPSSSWLLGVTDERRGAPRVRLRPARPTNPSLTYTIPHELTHLLQRPLRLAPQGERACDLHAIARAGDRFLVAPGYLRVPSGARREWAPWAAVAASLARESLRRRAEGERRYIAWWEAAFPERSAVHGPRSGVPGEGVEPP